MTALLEVRDLCAWYGEAQVLYGVDLCVGAGEMVALVGRNGAGRSTFAKALLGLARRAGTIRMAGTDIAALPTYRIARLGMGYVAEARDVFPNLTVEDNLKLGVTPRMRLRSLAVRAAIEAIYGRFPMLAERRATKAGVLSGGEQQVLALARALLNEPRLLIVDEPAEGLSPQSRALVAQALREVRAQGTAVLLIEQRLAIARELANRIAVMGHGRIVFDGGIDALDARVVDEWLVLGR